jgi:arylsulfatase A-like enzyme
MDLLPTFAKLSGGKVPTDRVIDGRDISPLLHGDKDAEVPQGDFSFYQHTHLQAVRSGRWKLVLPRKATSPWSPKGWAKMIAPRDAIEITRPMLFDLQEDIGEKTDVAASHPEVVAELMTKIQWARKDIGDHDRIRENARFFDDDPKRPDIGRPGK